MLVTADGNWFAGVRPEALAKTPYPSEFSECAALSDGTPVACDETFPRAETARVALAAVDRGAGVTAGASDQAGPVGFWWLPRGNGYLHRSVVVMATRTEPAANAGLHGYRYYFALTVAAALLLTTWLTLWLVRRLTRPLDSLREGALRIADGEFGQPVEATGSAEFGAVASAFNSMSARVQSLLSTRRKLADIDRMILLAEDREEVTAHLLRTLPGLITCSAVGVAVERNDGEGETLLHHGADDGVHQRTVIAPGAPFVELLRAGAPQILERDAAATSRLLGVLDGAATHCLLAPLHYAGHDGFLAFALTSPDDDPRPMLTLARELSDRSAVALNNALKEESLRHRANFDALTGLPNRSAFDLALADAMDRVRDGDSACTVLFLDIDRFKSINDALGHGKGDELLAAIARRLSHLASPQVMVARFGGDEFVLLNESAPDDAERQAQALVARLLDDASLPVQLGAVPHSVTVSVGYAIGPQDGHDAAELLMHADVAMYEAKAAGRNTARRYRASLGEAARERLRLENGLRTAIERGELELHLQPKVSLASDRPVGAEALVRWRSPEFGMVSPGRFIPVAEDSDLILALGAWVLRRGCEMAARWQREGNTSLTLAVNVSARQLAEPGFVEQVAQVLDDTSLPPSVLQVEVTESAFMGDVEQVSRVLERLADMEVSIAIDDFGTGYSSLSYLAKLPFHTLKIDQAFVSAMEDSPRVRSIVEATIAMAKALGLKLVAEGIETSSVHAALRALGCDIGQGYLYARPMPEAEFDDYLQGWTNARQLPDVSAG